MGKLLPLLFLAIGAGAGVGAGLFLAPSGDGAEKAGGHETGATDTHGDDAAHAADTAHAADDAHAEDGHGGTGSDFVKLNNQFVVPVVQQDRVAALVVLSLSLETRANLREVIFQREPKLRDAFLGVLFEHANMGGFNGSFTKSDRLDLLRTALREVARKEFGEDVVNVLIESIARQDTQG